MGDVKIVEQDRGSLQQGTRYIQKAVCGGSAFVTIYVRED